MTMQLDTTTRTNMATQLANAVAGGTMKLFSGAVPANCAAADPAGLLATGTLPNPALTAASGATAISGTWSATGSNGGTLACFRLYDTTAVCRAQGSVGWTAQQGAWAPSTAYAVGNTVSNGGNVYRCTTAGTSAASGGPTGTGTGIADGTAVWTYLGIVGDLNVDNTSISTGQVLTDQTFTYTIGGA